MDPTNTPTPISVPQPVVSPPNPPNPVTPPVSPIESGKAPVQSSATPLVLAVLSLILAVLVPVSLILAIIAIIMGTLAKKRGAAGKATAAIILGVLAIIVDIAIVFLVITSASKLFTSSNKIDTSNTVASAGVFDTNCYSLNAPDSTYRAAPRSDGQIHNSSGQCSVDLATTGTTVRNGQDTHELAKFTVAPYSLMQKLPPVKTVDELHAMVLKNLHSTYPNSDLTKSLVSTTVSGNAAFKFTTPDGHSFDYFIFRPQPYPLAAIVTGDYHDFEAAVTLPYKLSNTEASQTADQYVNSIQWK